MGETGPERPDEAYVKGETGEFQRIDLTTRDRVSMIQAKWEGSLRRMWFAIIGLYVVACVGGFFLYSLTQDNKDQNRALQRSRVQAAFEACQESNDRHDRTVKAFSVEFKRALNRTSSLQEKQQLQQSREANLRLINVFIPVHKDSAGRSTCREFARGRVNVDG